MSIADSFHSSEHVGEWMVIIEVTAVKMLLPKGILEWWSDTFIMLEILLKDDLHELWFYSPISQRTPSNPAVQTHFPGWKHVPPFKHVVLQFAENQPRELYLQVYFVYKYAIHFSENKTKLSLSLGWFPQECILCIFYTVMWMYLPLKWFKVHNWTLRTALVPRISF